MLNKYPIVGVMGSHENPWNEYAKPVGELLARRGFNLLTGAGDGVMTAVAKAFTDVDDRKGVAIGIKPADQAGQTREHDVARAQHETQPVDVVEDIHCRDLCHPLQCGQPLRPASAS